MRKAGLLAFVLLLFSSVSLGQISAGGGISGGGGGGGIGAGLGGQTTLTLLKFDSQKLIDDLANHAINSLAASISANIPLGDYFDKAIKDVLHQVYEGFACLIPNLSFEVSLTIPTTLTIQLPCKKISFNLAKYVKEGITQIAVKGAGVAMANVVEKCIFDESYAKSYAMCRFVVKEYKNLNSVALVGWSEDFTKKSFQDVQKEIKERSDLYGTPAVVVGGKNPTETQINVGSGRTRYGTLLSAGRSYGYIPAPDGTKQAKDLPEYLKPIYSYRVRNQVDRDALLIGYGKLLEKYRVQLAQAKTMMDGVCNTVYNVPIIAPGGIAGMRGPDLFSSPLPQQVSYTLLQDESNPLWRKFVRGSFTLSERFGRGMDGVEEELMLLLSGRLKPEEVLKLVSKTEGLTSFVPANPDTLRVGLDGVVYEKSTETESSCGGSEGILTRGCCYGCPCGAVSGIVGAAKAAIIARIELMEKILAVVISMESWGIRKQIHLETKAQAELLRKVLCAQAQLQYLSIAIQLAQMEVSLGILQTKYAELTNQEYELYERAKESMRRIYKRRE